MYLSILYPVDRPAMSCWACQSVSRPAVIAWRASRRSIASGARFSRG